MYTVVRFTIQQDRLHELLDIESDIGRIRPDVRVGKRKAGDGIVCDVSTSAFWWEHRCAILSFVNDCSEVLRRATARDALVAVDVAVEPEDRETSGPIIGVGCDVEFMTALVAHGIALEVSVY
jgi:hypothetical protein